VPQAIQSELKITGGEGDDEWIRDAFDEVLDGDGNNVEFFFGKAGNDVIRGSHKNNDS